MSPPKQSLTARLRELIDALDGNTRSVCGITLAEVLPALEAQERELALLRALEEAALSAADELESMYFATGPTAARVRAIAAGLRDALDALRKETP